MTDELSPKGFATLTELRRLGGASKEKGISAKKNRATVSNMLLKSGGVKHKPECIKCTVNCEVKHQEDSEFWAVKANEPPKYTLDTCPKKTEVHGVSLRDLKKSVRKRR
jgi:hypothetical protein